MSNVEIMRRFFYDLPERLAEDGISETVINGWNKEAMIYFISNLHMDYPTPEEQRIFEQNKQLWLLFYEMDVAAFL